MPKFFSKIVENKPNTRKPNFESSLSLYFSTLLPKTQL